MTRAESCLHFASKQYKIESNPKRMSLHVRVIDPHISQAAVHQLQELVKHTDLQAQLMVSRGPSVPANTHVIIGSIKTADQLTSCPKLQVHALVGNQLTIVVVARDNSLCWTSCQVSGVADGACADCQGLQPAS